MLTRTSVLCLLASTLVLFGSTSALAQNRTTSGTAALDATGTVTVDNHEGRITITTWNRNEVKYEAVIRPEADADHPEATTVRIDRDQQRFTIRTEYDESKASGGSFAFWNQSQNVMPVEYTLTVPRSARVEIDDHESEISIQNLEGRAFVETHDGSVGIQNHTGDVEIDSHDGPIDVETLTGDLTIDTHDSRIRLRSVDGHTRIDTHDSEIDAEQLRGGIAIDTHDGDGRLGFAALTGEVEIDTHDGDFALVVPTEAGFDLRTDFNDDSSLRADFDLTSYRVSTDDEDDEVNYDGRVNGGGPRVSLRSHDGSFEIRTQ